MPNVDRLVVWLLLENFQWSVLLRAEPIRDPNTICFCQHDSDVKVGDLNVSLVVAQDVVKFDVTVYDMLVMHVLEAFGDPPDRVLNEAFSVLLVEFIGYLSEVSAIHVL